MNDVDSSLIEMDSVSRSYPGPPPVTALSGVSFDIRKGDYATLVGPSGAGKSTLLNLIGLLDTPTSGRYVLNGVDTSLLNENERTALRGRTIGFVFQAFHLMNHRTVVENVELSMLYDGSSVHERRPRALAAIDDVGLSHRALAFPSTLSGGERQRVAIARAIVSEPELLLCDEPTGNLDSRTAEKVLDLLDTLNERGRTIVMITHDARVASRGRTQIEIIDGQLATSRTTAVPGDV